MIDWNDFVVVQTLDFDDDARSYPAPVDLANKERTDHMQFNKANINPDYAFMYDASQAFVGGGRKQKAERGRQKAECVARCVCTCVRVYVCTCLRISYQ